MAMSELQDVPATTSTPGLVRFGIYGVVQIDLITNSGTKSFLRTAQSAANLPSYCSKGGQPDVKRPYMHDEAMG